jgi:amidase
MAGSDPADVSTEQSVGKVETDYTKFLKVGSLKGARIGIGRDFSGRDLETIGITEESIATLKRLGPSSSIRSGIPTTFCKSNSHSSL